MHADNLWLCGVRLMISKPRLLRSSLCTLTYPCLGAGRMLFSRTFLIGWTAEHGPTPPLEADTSQVVSLFDSYCIEIKPFAHGVR
jgi:hypothetical protein